MAALDHGVTGLLGDAAALDRLVPIVYGQLRRWAQHT
jgi:hypothetical protein